MLNRPESVLLDDSSATAAKIHITNPQMDRLRIPQESDYQLTAESPVDRFGPRLRKWSTTTVTTRSSASQPEWGGSTQCYSPIEGAQPSFRKSTTPDFTDIYSNLQVYEDSTHEDIPQVRVEGERPSVEVQQRQPEQTPPRSPKPEQTRESSAVHKLPAQPKHCYHGSMSSEESFELATAFSRTPELPSIDLKAEDNMRYQHPPTWQVNLVIGALALTTICTGWDNTMIATAIPRITDHFHSLNDIEWYEAAYLLANCSVQLTYGKLYHLHSVKIVYLTALLIFQLGSFICGIAPSSLVLIIGRAVAGLGSAGLLSGSILIIRKLVRYDRRPVYMAGLASMLGVAYLTGPIIGGAFTDSFSWRWCFYINLPFGFVTSVLLVVFYQPPQRQPCSQRTGLGNSIRFLDVEGTALLIPAIISLLLALQWGGARYPWGSVQVIVLFVICGITLAGFILVQMWKQELATIPPRIIRGRNVSCGFVFTFFFGAALVVATYYIPLWLQAIRSASARDSGAMLYPLVVSMVVTSMLVAYLVTLIGYYTPFMILASLLMAIGGGLLSTLNSNSSSAKQAGYQIIFGIGVGCGIQQSVIAIQAAVKGSGSRNSTSSGKSNTTNGGNAGAVPMGTAIVTFAQTLGGAVFLAVAQSVFDNKLSIGIQTANIPGLEANVALDIGATELRNAVASEHVHTVLRLYAAAINSTFLVVAAAAAASILGALGMDWISIRQR